MMFIRLLQRVPAVPLPFQCARLLLIACVAPLPSLSVRPPLTLLLLLRHPPTLFLLLLIMILILPTPRSSLVPLRLALHVLTRDQLKLLWHQRLGHLHARRVSNLHRCVRSFPQLPDRNELETCPICQEQKLHRSS